MEVRGGEDWARVSGLVSRPDGQRAGRPNLRLFVNGRPVRDRALAKAVSEAYRRVGAGDRGFDAFLRLEVPSHLVDVNVHPAKTEVRFADPRTVWTAVERALREALARGATRAPSRGIDPALGGLAHGRDAGRGAAAVRPAGKGRLRARPGSGSSSGGRSRPVASEESVAAAAAELHVLGQHRNTYIVASDGEELVLVDQHTAHERVRFEQLLGARRAPRG